MLIAIAYSPGQTPERIRYTLDFLAQHPLAPKDLEWQYTSTPSDNALQIYYGPASETPVDAFHIPAQELIFQEIPPPFTALQAGIYTYEKTRLYSVEKKALDKKPFFQNQEFAFDILETIFFHISRLEEYHCTPEQWDEWDMMKAEEQFLVKQGLEQQPIVDQLVMAFYRALGFTLASRRSVYEMSHDIDLIRKFKSPVRVLRSMGSALYRGRGLPSLWRIGRGYWQTQYQQQKDPYNTFEWLLTKAPMRKVMYLMTGGITPHDNHYAIDDPLIARAIEMALTNGYEIGLHPSYAAHRREDLWREEKACLEKVVGQSIRSSRQHFLHFDFPETANILEALGIENDSTLGFQDRLGFRCGTGFAYRLYHFAEKRAYTFWETPMVIMDSALLQYCQQDLTAFERQFWQFLDANQENTQVTFNFHNSTFDETIMAVQKLKQLYLALPDYCRAKQ